MAGAADWFQREERIGHISDIRVHNLQIERVRTQKRTFTRWINFHLDRCKPPLEVKDLFNDMQDGKVLMSLLEVLSGQPLMQHYKQSTHRIFRLNNIARALKFLEDGYVRLVSIDAPEIADGNPSLILGLIWNIILHFQIKEAAGHLKIFSPTASLCSLHNGGDVHLPGDPASPRATVLTVPSKDHRKVIKALLKWVQRRTAKYGVAVQDFGSSWRSGIAFLALIKAIEPSLVDMREAMERPSRVNLEDAFKIAAENLEIPPLLEPEDVDVERPEEQSITTYVSQFLEHFPDMDESDLLGDASEPPLENPYGNTGAVPSDLAVDTTYKSHEMVRYNVLNDAASPPRSPNEDVHSSLTNEVFHDQPLGGEDDRPHVLTGGVPSQREAASPPAIPQSNRSHTPSPRERESSSWSLPPSPDATEAVEEIYVVLHPVRRKSSMGEKILVLDKDPSCPTHLSPDDGSPGAAKTAGIGSGETSQPSGSGASVSSQEDSTDEAATLSCDSHHTQGLSSCPEALLVDAGSPARQRTVSESCTQTEGKQSPRQHQLFHPAFFNDEKLSVIPHSLLYYPHYNVPVSEVVEAYSITDGGVSPQKEIDAELLHGEESSPLTDEAYQSCSELGSAFSLQGLSPTISDYTLYSPDSDGAGPWNDSTLPQAGANTQPGTVTSKCVSAAQTSAPLQWPDVFHEQPDTGGVNGRRDEKPKDGEPEDSQGDGQDDEEEWREDAQEVEEQRWQLQSHAASTGTEGIGKGAERSVDGWEFDASFYQPAVLQATGTSSSTSASNAEDVRIATSRDHQGSEEDCLPQLMDEHHVTSWQEEVNKQDGMELWLEPGQLQEEHFEDADPSAWTKFTDCPSMLNETQTTEQIGLTTRSTLESRRPRPSTFGRGSEAGDHHGETTSGSPPADPQLPYLIILLWMIVYWMIVLLHLDLESSGPPLLQLTGTK
ncbi:calmin-like [Leucoraja erinacea]|uniref:calmin-like n=1 Tax=Leucoraja erinaceus TaxID=7782 RepID=UPI002455555D|nr:calmin-like [Leucoraja erinacea]